MINFIRCIAEMFLRWARRKYSQIRLHADFFSSATRIMHDGCCEEDLLFCARYTMGGPIFISISISKSLLARSLRSCNLITNLGASGIGGRI